MEKLKQLVEDELHKIEQCGLSTGNLGMTGDLVDILKDLSEIDKNKESEEMRDYGRYYDDYRDGGSYNARGGRGNYRGGGFLDSRLDRLMDSADFYQYMKSRYRDGGSQDRMVDGIERLMYAVCSLVESVQDFAETPEEKEVIRKHIQKIQAM